MGLDDGRFEYKGVEFQVEFDRESETWSSMRSAAS